MDGDLDVIDVTTKADDHNRVKGGIARGTAQLTALLDYVTGQQDLIDFIAAATPPGTIAALVVTVDTGKLYTVQALLTKFAVVSPEGSSVAEVVFDFVLDGAIATTWA